MLPTKVKDRKNRLRPFNESRIYNAVKRACEEVYPNNEDVLRQSKEISTEVLRRLDKDYDIETVSIYTIQSLVLEVLKDVDIKTHTYYEKYSRLRSAMRAYSSPPKAISEYILNSKYLRKEDKGRWENAVARVEDMHISTYPELEVEIREAFDKVRAKSVLPSMRSLQFGGTAILANHARMYNCSYSPVDNIDFFEDLFFLLLSGCGVGYSVSNEHIRKLPKVIAPNKDQVHHFDIEDSIEGWSYALYYLLASYFVNSNYVEFNYSQIRPEGAELVTSGGKAPGHLPLKKLLETLRDILDEANGRHLRAFEVHRICCLVADSVLSGGIRRSSLICLFDSTDEELMNCKTGDWYSQYPELALANNSVINPSEDQIEDIFDSIQHFGEPGIVNIPNSNYGFNPCGEILMNSWSEKNDSYGFGFCNLTEINLATVTSGKDFLERCEVAAFIGTLQAGYTDIKVACQTASEEYLLGVSITGVVDVLNEVWFTDKVLRRGYDLIKTTNEFWAQRIAIKPAKRLTTVKPSGTASLVLGAVGSGMHPHHSKRYIRRVLANENEPSFQAYRKANPKACIQKPDGKWVIEFPLEAEGITRKDMTAKELLNLQDWLYQNWVNPYGKTLAHNVSATIDVKPQEWEEVKEYVLDRVPNSSCPATSFLASSGDKVYPFAPREDANTPASMQRWMELVETYSTPDYSNCFTTEVGSACEGPSCEIPF